MCLPGLTRNARDFTTLATALAAPEGRHHHVIVLESRGRGRSDRGAGETYTLPRELADLHGALDEWDPGPVDFVGTSRGGLLAMLFAAQHPGRVGRIVMNDIGPAIETSGLARIAASVGAQMDYASFEALGAALKSNLAAQFPRMNDAQWARMARQLASPTDAGGVRLDYDAELAAPLRGTGTATLAPDFWPVFYALGGHPLLVLRGANSDLLSSATVESMRRHHSAMNVHIVLDEGHAPLLWDRASIDAIDAFLAGR